MHATGLQMGLELIENDCNNLSLGYSYARDSDNSPLLKMIFPNMLRIGRINNRALAGPIRMSASPGELTMKIEKTYSAFYKLWNTTMIPKLMKMNKWFDTKSQLKIGDVVFFRKVENELSSEWTVGIISDIVKSKDDIIRRVEVKYQNAKEDKPRFTDRAARSIIKLFNIDDTTWQDDMNAVEVLIKAVQKEDEENEHVDTTINNVRIRHGGVGGYDKPKRDEGVQYNTAAKIARSKLAKTCKKCCCSYHCVIEDHGKAAVPIVVDGINYGQEHLYSNLFDSSWDNTEQYEENLVNITTPADHFMSLVCALQLDLEDDGNVS